MPYLTPVIHRYHHWKKEVKKSINADVQRGITEPVPIGEPVEWCAQMVVIPKKDGQPRCTVDLQKLNAQCSRETHHCQSPFQLACQIPSNTKKTVLDAVDGFHAIPLDEASKKLTTFITEWGRYRYCRLPQGYLAATDAYTRRYDDIIKDVKNKVKIVDDTLLFDDDIESSFYHTWDYLTLCYSKGIIFNKSKFQFCQDTVNFAGLKITPDGITPSDQILSAIENFPTPKSLTDARSWFGLVNQVAWAYSVSNVMQPFREMVKSNSKFYWDEQLEEIFNKSKDLLLNQVTKGIRSFDVNKTTCLQTDWSKDGIGYLLLQKHCSCPNDKAPTCCREGWKLIFAGSRFTKGAESNYSPTEGESLAIAWSINHAKLFVLGCKSLIVVSDHKPLLGIFNNRTLTDIDNPRICRLKEKTLSYNFKIQYNPGKWNRGADAFSRNPSNKQILETQHVYTVTIEHNDQMPTADDTTVNTINQNNIQEFLQNGSKSSMVLSTEHIKTACIYDSKYQTLTSTIKSGFPSSKTQLNPDIRTYWEVRHRLSLSNDLIWLDNHRIVIPDSYITPILHILHAAHQGTTSMTRRANQTVYWPGMHHAIKNIRYNCNRCNNIAPSQPKEPIILTKTPEYPFQFICADYFEIKSHHYLVIVDRFSGWIILYHFQSTQLKSNSLINACREIFTNYGAPEEISTDGGPQFIAQAFQQFLQSWNVEHRNSSAHYPQSNGRAELAVKSAKRIIYDNTLSDGSLNTDKAARAILQHRNTPLPDINLSPAQLLFHRELRYHLPSHPKHYQLHKSWIISRKQLEQKTSLRNQHIVENYNSSAHSLKPLEIKTMVLINNTKPHSHSRWDRQGIIVEVLPYRQYKVKINGSGRIVLRNRKFLKPINGDQIKLKPSLSPTLPTNNESDTNPLVPTHNTPNTDQQIRLEENASPNSVTVYTDQPLSKMPRALKRLQSFNKPGLKE